tara:strand:- start:70 stop:642 length:573 start_codon:yes stop_codon:yes gene_type:complete
MNKIGEYKIIDNFLPENDFRIVSDMMWSIDFNWHFTEYYNAERNVNDKDNYNYYFTHVFYAETNSPGWVEQSFDFWRLWTRIQNNIQKFVNPNKNFHLMRVKGNYYHKQETCIKHGYHQDMPHVQNNVALYFLNTNDAKTYIKDIAEVEAIENRLLLFNGHDWHTSSSPTNNKGRITININYQEFEDGEL